MLKIHPCAIIVTSIPEIDLEKFLRYQTDKSLIYADESILSENLTSRIKVEAGDRSGWYLQQFIKLELARKFGTNKKIGMIWDSDSLPVAQLKHFGSNQEILFAISNFQNPAYFDQIMRSLQIEKQIQGSFISQYMIFKQKWLEEIVQLLGGDGKYLDKLAESIDFSIPSGFSEYEFLGSYIYQNHRSEIGFEPSFILERLGNSRFGGFSRFNNLSNRFRTKHYHIISYESWDPEFNSLDYFFVRIKSILRRRIKMVLTRVKVLQSRQLNQFDLSSAPLRQIIYQFIERHEKSTIVQIGACDGVQNDFVREVIIENKNNKKLKFHLIEPIPYYAKLLRKIYGEFSNVEIEMCAIGKENGTEVLYFIDPSIADEMNGRGPHNNWAHGQGSFSKQKIIDTISDNSFRGPAYVANIPQYTEAIKQVDVEVKTLSEIINRNMPTLLVIDVQGAEMQVLEGISREHLPEIVIVENEFPDDRILNFLTSLGYFRSFVGHDEAYSLRFSSH